jgi:hypothetical protein
MENDFKKQLQNYKNLPKTDPIWNNSDFFYFIIDENSMNNKIFQLFSEAIRSDISVINNLITNNPNMFKYIMPELKDNEDIVFLALKEDINNFEHISNRLQEDTSFLKEIIDSLIIDEDFVKKLSDSVLKDRELTQLILKKVPYSFPLIFEEYKFDLDIVYGAMFDSGLLHAPLFVYESTPLEIRQNKDFNEKCLSAASKFRSERGKTINKLKSIHNLAVAESNGEQDLRKEQIKEKLKDFKSSFKRDSYGYSFEYNNKEFDIFLDSDLSTVSSDNQIMKMLVKVDFLRDGYNKKAGKSLEKISEDLRNDVGFICSILKETDSSVYRCLEDVWKCNKDILMEYINSNISPEDIPKSLRNDKGFILELAMKNPYSARRVVSPEILNNKDFVKQYLKIDGHILSDLPTKMKSEKEIIYIAISSGDDVLSHANKNILYDKEVILEAIRNGGSRFITHLPLTVTSDRSFILSLIDEYDVYQEDALYRKSPKNIARDILQSIPLEFKKDKEFCQPFILLNGWGINNLDESIKYDIDILKAAFSSGCHVYKDLDMDKIKTLYPQDYHDIIGDMESFI